MVLERFGMSNSPFISTMQLLEQGFDSESIRVFCLNSASLVDITTLILSQTEALNCPIIRPQKSRRQEGGSLGEKSAALSLLPNPGDDQHWQRERYSILSTVAAIDDTQPHSQQGLESLQPEENH